MPFFFSFWREISNLFSQKKNTCEKFQILYVIRVVYYCLELLFSSLNNTYLCSVSSLFLNTLPCSPLLLPHVSRFLPLFPHYSLFLFLFVSLLCSFHAPFSACFSLVYTLSSYMWPLSLSGFISTRRRANHLQ